MSHNPYAAPESSGPPPLPEGDYELATRMSRLGAAIVDGLIIAGIQFGLLFATGAWGRMMKAAEEAQRTGASLLGMEQFLWSIVGIVIFIAINWNFLANGQTVGKRIAGIQVRSVDGDILSRQHIILKRYLPMWVAAMLPVVGRYVGLIDALFIFGKERRTIHDLIAGTQVTVLRKEP